MGTRRRFPQALAAEREPGPGEVGAAGGHGAAVHVPGERAGAPCPAAERAV